MCCSSGFNGADTLTKMHDQSTFDVGLYLLINSRDPFVLM